MNSRLKKGLGRGLSSLIGETKNEIKTAKIYQDAYKIYCILFDNDGYPNKVSKIISNPYNKIILKELFKKEATGDFIVYID